MVKASLAKRGNKKVKEPFQCRSSQVNSAAFRLKNDGTELYKQWL
ncbi:hypothetical protein midi_01260 [Candidatus Midichloria mitochondrii IricVA]|uniref:Uncharacterized protein n=1 Tax=Midichloria mitochondrii (strain IricVA) TaxID=696127 RepID=F7XUH2_MIDMI|nr:hypothetical protein midi_01260 [Candidatus Midichloria mitochondrii IricVA]